MDTRVVDDLGRIVIPKDIRDEAQIKVGDRVSIERTECGTIVLRRYWPSDKMISILNDICTYLHSITNLNIVITDKERILASDSDLSQYSCNLPIWYEKYINNYPNSFESENEFCIFNAERKHIVCTYSGSVLKLNKDNEVEFSIVILNGEKETINRKVFEKFVNVIEIIIRNFRN